MLGFTSAKIAVAIFSRKRKVERFYKYFTRGIRQSPGRRPRDFLRWLPANQAPRSFPNRKRRPSSSSRRSTYFLKRQRHFSGIVQFAIGRIGA